MIPILLRLGDEVIQDQDGGVVGKLSLSGSEAGIGGEGEEGGGV